jgi:hypothetical protein
MTAWPGALFAHPGCCSFEDRSRDLAAVVAVDLDVGEAAVIVDHDVRELDPSGAMVACLLAAIAVRPVSGCLEAAQLFGVHVQERAGLRPLVATTDALSWSSPSSRAAVTA